MTSAEIKYTKSDSGPGGEGTKMAKRKSSTDLSSSADALKSMNKKIKEERRRWDPVRVRPTPGRPIRLGL